MMQATTVSLSSTSDGTAACRRQRHLQYQPLLHLWCLLHHHCQGGLEVQHLVTPLALSRPAPLLYFPCFCGSLSPMVIHNSNGSSRRCWGRPLSIWIIKKTMYIQVSDSDHLFLLKIIRPMNSKILMNLYPCHLGYWAASMTSAVSVSRTQWWICSTRSEVVSCPVSTLGHLSILPHTVQTQTHILAKTINLESLETSILTNR